MTIAVSTTFEVNASAVDDLASDPALFDVLVPVAEEIAALGASYAPRHLARSIEILGQEVDEQGAVVYVGTTNSLAHLWEFGSINTDTYGFMRAAGASSGADSFEES